MIELGAHSCLHYGTNSANLERSYADLRLGCKSNNILLQCKHATNCTQLILRKLIKKKFKYKIQ